MPLEKLLSDYHTIMERPVILYINPQSMRNLAIYDYSLLTNLDADIHYVCSKYYDYKSFPPSVKQHKIFGYNHLNNNLLKAISYVCSYIVVLFLIARVRPEAIHIQWFRLPQFDGLLIRLVKKLFKCKFVFTAHNVLPHDTNEKFKEIFARIYKTTDAIIVHSKTTKEELLSLFDIPEEKVSVIEHGLIELGVDRDLLLANEKAYEKKYNLEGKVVFASLGYQYNYKGIDVVAKVWASTPELCQSSQCKLLIIGRNKGVDLSTLKDIDNVVIDDRLISEEEFYYLLTHTDVYLLPYRKISQSGVLMSAISTGTPILATKVGGLTEPIDIAPIGWTIPHLDPQVLQDKMVWLASHQKEIEMTKNNQSAWDKVRAHYSWDRIGKLTTTLYKQI